MTANQRRPGFRLPWSSEDEPQGGAVRTEQPSVTGSATPSTNAQPMPASAEDEPPTAAASDEQPDGATGVPRQPSDEAEAAEAAAAGAGGEPAEGSEAAGDREPASTSQNTEQDAAAEAGREPDAPRAGAADDAPPPADDAPPPADEARASSQPPGADEGPEVAAGTGFMHELVEAMRRVADEARQARLAEARSEADTEIGEIEAAAERRRNELRAQAEADIAGVGDWAKAEAERIRTEAEQRVAARRAELERQLAAESAHGEARAGVLRARVSEYERELQAFHAKLSDIQDPAAFAAAVKRMPRRAGEAPLEEADEPAAARPADTAVTTTPTHGDGDNGVAPAPEAEDDRGTMQAAQAEGLATPRVADERDYASGEPTFTEIVVKGLGSFGAITGFRQQLASVPGVDAVGLSLGTTGEFIFKATHAGGFDVANAIRGLEGDAVSIEQRPEGGLRVTLDRPR